jgi:hypothetical protein
MTNQDHLRTTPAGWQSLVQELDSRLQERWPSYMIMQIKEKFGTLRFYAEPLSEAPDFPDGAEGDAAHNQWYAENIDTFHDLIHEYEARSAHLCQLCGEPGELGTSGYWWVTCCARCAPEGWVSNNTRCDHLSIIDGTCVSCGRQRLARLEHTEQVLTNTHPADSCAGESCTIHKRSEHPMRTFPQHWRSDRALMERICPHGVGHPDPDDHKLTGPHAQAEATHGCDGCCSGAYQ